MDDNHDFELTYRLINDKINKKAVLTYKEQEFYFEGTKKECRQNVILLPQMKEYAFFVFYNIYLTDINSEINKMSKIHSSDTPIREVYGINLKHYELLELLIIYVNEFKREVLENNNLYKENNNLKNTIKREFKKVLKKIVDENVDVENNIFNEVLHAKKIYLHFLNLVIKNEKVVFDSIKFDLQIDFYIHIAFCHYFHVLQKTNHYIEKDHFDKIKPEEWREIIIKLSNKLEIQKLSLNNTCKIDFILENIFYRVAFDKKKKRISSLFPLKKEEIKKLDLNSVIELSI